MFHPRNTFSVVVGQQECLLRGLRMIGKSPIRHLLRNPVLGAQWIEVGSDYESRVAVYQRRTRGQGSITHSDFSISDISTFRSEILHSRQS